MSEQKLVSPLLDGFQMGDPISSHDGVDCCPAIKENSDHKYIVKILSIPASQSQLDALLLAGAFQDAAGALEYFKDLADGVVREVKLHQQLARLDGFVPCDAWQVVPMDDNQLGYEVYLLTPYHRTLDRYMKKAALTHLEAVNLGLDLCAALTACRRSGHLYVDLKPSNIFMASDREFLIGDLGFMSMDSLKYAALPTKYRSVYTAPEMDDALSVISDTADVYALGLILYQIYNDGQLPAPAEENGVMAAPANADYEMAEIILKACAIDPEQRWQDPAQMGQALVAYRQRNAVNDTPILPPDLTPEEPEEPEEEEIVEEEAAEVEQTAAEEETPAEEDAAEEAAEAEEIAAEETVEEEPATEEPVEEPQEAEEEPAEQTEDETETVEAEAVEETAEAEETEATEETEEETEVTEEAEETAETEEESPVSEEIAFIEALESDEAEPDAQTEAVMDNAEISEETSAILAQADELAALEVPEPVVVTAPQLPEEEASPESEEEPAAEAEAEDEDDGEDEIDIPIAIPELAPIKKTGKKWLVTLLIFALLIGAGYTGNYYYQNYYLVPVESIALDGGCDEITADIAVSFDETKITAVCTDTYGNTVTSPVANGKAHFTGLNPGTQYTVTLQVDGFNELVGNNTASFTTTQQTKVVSIAATTGAEDGDVILSFTVDGFDPQNWTVEYATEGEEAQTRAFTGHIVTVPGLTVGAPYTFNIYPTEQLDAALVGETTLEFTASQVILAQDVSIDSLEEDVLTLVWNVPADTAVANWTVTCTADGYDETVTVSDATAQFTGIEVGKTYTVEILADGMTQSSRTEITATPLTISNLEATLVNDRTLRVTWEYSGDAPENGWAVHYSIDGGKTVEEITSDTNAADLSLVVFNASYKITVQGVDTATTSSFTFDTPSAPKFTDAELSYSFCKTPSKDNWDYSDVEEYAKVFKSGKSISMVVFASKDLTATGSTRVQYVIRDAEGNVISDLCSVKSVKNKTMWEDCYFYPTLPKTPKDAGKYTLELYFDGELAVRKSFEIVK